MHVFHAMTCFSCTVEWRVFPRFFTFPSLKSLRTAALTPARLASALHFSRPQIKGHVSITNLPQVPTSLFWKLFFFSFFPSFVCMNECLSFVHHVKIFYSAYCRRVGCWVSCNGYLEIPGPGQEKQPFPQPPPAKGLAEPQPLPTVSWLDDSPIWVIHLMMLFVRQYSCLSFFFF